MWCQDLTICFIISIILNASCPLVWYFVAQQRGRQQPKQPLSQTKASLMPGKTVPKWFAECPVEWLMRLALAAVRQLLIALLAMHISHSLTLPRIARSQTGQETTLELFSLSSNWPLMGAGLSSDAILSPSPVMFGKSFSHRSESANSIF